MNQPQQRTNSRQAKWANNTNIHTNHMLDGIFTLQKHKTHSMLHYKWENWGKKLWNTNCTVKMRVNWSIQAWKICVMNTLTHSHIQTHIFSFKRKTMAPKIVNFKINWFDPNNFFYQRSINITIIDRNHTFWYCRCVLSRNNNNGKIVFLKNNIPMLIMSTNCCANEYIIYISAVFVLSVIV